MIKKKEKRKKKKKKKAINNKEQRKNRPWRENQKEKSIKKKLKKPYGGWVRQQCNGGDSAETPRGSMVLGLADSSTPN
jgi:hypothetical protein